MDATHDQMTAVDSAERADRELLNRIAQHDPQAFETYYQRYQPRLTAYLRTFLKSPELIEDVLQDVMLAVWLQAGSYRATGRVSTWLFGIARNKAFRAHAQTTKALPALPAEPEDTNQHDPELHMTRRECEHWIRQALITLPPVEREVFTMRQAHGCSVQTIASHQACSVATVNYRLRQARRHLISRLSAWGVTGDTGDDDRAADRSASTRYAHA